MHETENALLYAARPDPHGPMPPAIGVRLDEDALRALFAFDGGAPLTIDVDVVDARGEQRVARAHDVLEVAGRWFGPVVVEGKADAAGTLPLPRSRRLTLRIAARVATPLGIDVQ